MVDKNERVAVVVDAATLIVREGKWREGQENNAVGRANMLDRASVAIEEDEVV